MVLFIPEAFINGGFQFPELARLMPVPAAAALPPPTGSAGTPAAAQNWVYIRRVADVHEHKHHTALRRHATPHMLVRVLLCAYRCCVHLQMPASQKIKQTQIQERSLKCQCKS